MAATPKLEFRDRARHPTCSSPRTTTKRQLREEIIDAAIEVFADSGADLDTTATSRAVVGMIFGLAMIGLNPAFDTDDWSNTIQAAVRLMFDGISNHPEQTE